MPMTTVFLSHIDIRDFPTKAKLNKLAKADNESYDSIICRLLHERDNRTCQLCGVKENGRKKLNVHHIHYDKPNCEPDLVSLCNCCNAKVNFNRDYWELYFMKLLESKNLLWDGAQIARQIA